MPGLESLPFPLPTMSQLVFGPLALFTAGGALLVVLSRSLYHGALGLVATLFGVAGIYAMLEAEFLAVAQVLVYVGAIATLIAFAIMLTRGMMFGLTSPVNRQMLASIIVASMFFFTMMGVVMNVPWVEAYTPLESIEWPDYSREAALAEAEAAAMAEEATTEESVEAEGETAAAEGEATEGEAADTESEAVAEATEGEATEGETAEEEAEVVAEAETDAGEEAVAEATFSRLPPEEIARVGESIIGKLGESFVTLYLIPFELMALLLLVALAGALMLARDR